MKREGDGISSFADPMRDLQDGLENFVGNPVVGGLRTVVRYSQGNTEELSQVQN